MKTGIANLRISYLGGGYDFPEFFDEAAIAIVSEGIPMQVKCELTDTEAQWTLPEGLMPGLGSSAAKHLSYLRAKYPMAEWREHIDVAILLDRLQAGGYQDSIACAYQGVVHIVIGNNGWEGYLCNIDLSRYRKLYKIPVAPHATQILTQMRCRSSSFAEMQNLVAAGRTYLDARDWYSFGRAVLKGWQIKKQWHPDICNLSIMEMEDVARHVGAWGWKVCGAGGQGYFLVIGDIDCHAEFSQHYEPFEVDHV